MPVFFLTNTETLTMPMTNKDVFLQVADLPVLTQSLAALFLKKMEGRKLK